MINKLIALLVMIFILIGCTSITEDSSVVLNCSETTNYVYHMLSVSGVGYSNTYGDKYSTYHDKDDLNYLKTIEDLLITHGGKSIGPLMNLAISIPSSLEDMNDLETHYRCIKKILSDENLTTEENDYLSRTVTKLSMSDNILSNEEIMDFVKSQSYKEELIRVSEIFIDNMEIYSEHIYPIESEIIENYIDNYLSKNDFKNTIKNLEEIIGLGYKYEYFIVELTRATEFGPTAMNPSWYQNTHYIYEDYNFKEFITHEIAIYILVQNGVFDMEEYSDYSYNDIWIAFESLAEYYNEEYYGRKTSSYSDGDPKIINYIRENSTLSANEQMVEVLKAFY